jgi:vancomycin resistance protein YoaR
MEKWAEEDHSMAYAPNYSSEIENTDICQYQKSILCNLTFSRKNSSHVQKKILINLDEDLISRYLGNLAKQFNKDPENAKFKIEDGKVSAFSLNEKGRKLDEEKGLELLANYLKDGSSKDSLDLPYEEIKPEISIDSVDSMGITSLIGEGQSNFKGSPKNRIFNIQVATKRFDGVLIRPGEEFSFVKVLGEVDGEHGYLPELVIKHDKTEPEFGGGICQVSTTAFRAAINSGLEITARRNHAYPVAYYNPQGMDATVYVPKPDLRFKNNTPGYILIQTKIEGTQLTFDFYGTPDERKVNIIGPKILERNSDGSMKTTFTQQVFDKDGNMIKEAVFNSSYDSPSKYPHPGSSTDVLTQKPNSWSDREWKDYKKAHGL